MNKSQWLPGIALFLITVLSSCQKELSLTEQETNTGNGAGNSALLGNWKFTGAQAEGQSVAEITESGSNFKTISSLNYTTGNNKGTLKIEATKMSYTGLSYTATGAMQVDMYEGINLLISQNIPIDFTIPASNTTANYQQIGTDSIYTPGGGLISIGGLDNTPQQAGGAKFKIENGKLTITAIMIQEENDNSIPGVIQTTKSVSKGTFTFEKL